MFPKLKYFLTWLKHKPRAEFKIFIESLFIQEKEKTDEAFTDKNAKMLVMTPNKCKK